VASDHLIPAPSDRHLRVWLAFSCLIFIAALTFLPHTAYASNRVTNGDLSQGSGGAPADWKPDGWMAGATTFKWLPGSSGQLIIINQRPNDARWVQHLHLTPGWYHFSADLRTRQVGSSNTGASLSLLQYWITSQELHGTNDWQPVDFYLKVGKAGADVDLACRLGGYGSTNDGEVDCRHISALAVAPPSPTTPHQFDLDALRAASTPPPQSGNTAMFLLVLGIPILLFVIAYRARALKSGPGGPSDSGTPGTSNDDSPEPGPPPRADAGMKALAVDASPALQPIRKIEIALFLLCMLSFAYFYQASDHSTASRIDLIRALTERGTVWIDWYAGFNTADIVQLGSHIYSNKAPGGALSGLLPWVLVTGPMHLLMKPGPWFWALATYLTTLLSVSLISALLCLLAYRFALLLGASQRRAVMVALTLTFATIMFPHATEFTAEPIAAFCVFAAFYLLVAARPADGLGAPLAAGLLAGWSVLCDYPTAILAAVVGFYALWKLRDWRKIGVFSAAAGAMALLLATYDYLAFGNPFFLSYEAYMLPGSDRFAAQKVGFAGVTYPHWSILWNVLFGAQRGLFFCNPVMLLVIPALLYCWRMRAWRAEFIAMAVMILGFVLFNGSYGDSVVYWGGGTATGPRHMISALPFMVLVMIALPAVFDYPWAALALLSVFFMLMATSIDPHLPYEYDNPLRYFLWPAYLRGDLAFNKGPYFGGPPIVGDAVAFNLGKLAGLPGALQLFPLLGLWLTMGWLLWQKLAASATPSRWPLRAGALALVAMFIPPLFGSLFMRPNLKRPYGLLGRYYEGLDPGQFPPHIVRVDRQIAFDSIVALGSLPYPSCVTWEGSIFAPVAGRYRFLVTADDAGWLSIDGKPVIRDPGDVTRLADEGEILMSAGWHSILIGQRNIWGGASMHLYWQPPGGSGESLVPSHYLRPDRVISSPRLSRLESR
jgi:hypothetical protein